MNELSEIRNRSLNYLKIFHCGDEITLKATLSLHLSMHKIRGHVGMSEELNFIYAKILLRD